ncbi:hypothetical protein KNJ79_06495 [Sphingopyxis indica]|uniref:hypothetical protein n=1 Tax=Sphingopyxis indica TaxID=436663 RepID=UPI00293915E9|nr:hypothetical protein [Sphingopyxis indica]WOF44566.1 hypothetical protein KNJ79_06495 [Sphingopyxis indica]
MVARLGISILDLLPQTSELANFVPDEAVERIGTLTVLEHRSTTSTDFVLHTGVLQSIGDVLDIDVARAALKIPGLTTGLPFRLAVRRSANRPGGQEAPPSDWTLDISASNIELELPFLQGARQTGGAGLEVLHLERLDPLRKVFLVAAGVIRVQGAVGRAANFQLVDTPDPFDPTFPTGAVARLTVRPPHFFFGGSEYGMTLDRFTLDLSSAYTPADIVARGHDEGWTGVAFKETTFYTPPNFPLLPNLSISARDVIVGDPGGRQGELRVEWGFDFEDERRTHIKVLRKPVAKDDDDVEVAQTTPAGTAGALEYGIDISQAALTDQVRVQFGVGDLIPGHTDFGVVGVWWRLPDGTEGNSATTPYFTVPSDTPLRYKLRLGNPAIAYTQPDLPSAVPSTPEEQIELIEVAVRFPRIGAPKPAAPFIDATIGGATFSNVLHLRGPRELLKGIELKTRRGNGAVDANWQLGSGSAAPTATKKQKFTLPELAEGPATLDLMVTAQSDTRRLRIDIIRSGRLLVGHQTGSDNATPAVVSVAGFSEVTPAKVVDTFESASFHQNAERHNAAQSADLAPPNVTIPAGAIAEVELPVPVDAATPIPSTPAQPGTILHSELQLLFAFDEPSAQGDVKILSAVYPATPTEVTADLDRGTHLENAQPIAAPVASRGAPDGGAVSAKIRHWVEAQAAGTQYIVVGRTDDLRFNVDLATNNSKNADLADRRRKAAVEALTAAGIAPDKILSRIETDPSPAGWPTFAELPTRFAAVQRLALPGTPAGTTKPRWNGAWTDDGATSSQHAKARDDDRRKGYRCADIFAYVEASPPQPPPQPPTQANDVTPVRILLPGPDGPPPPKIPSTETQGPPIDYRVRARAKWDSPTVVNSADLIPTEAELLIAWKSAETELPATVTGPPGSLTIPKPTGPDFWEMILRLAYDARTGQTQLDGSLGLPDGALLIRSDALAGALAFAPAFVALINPADIHDDEDTNEKLAALAAVLAAGAIAGTLLNDGDPESTVDIDKFAISYRWNGNTRVSATVDYSVDLNIDVDLPGGSFLKGEVKLKYKGVGLYFDSAKSGLASVGVSYSDVSVEIVGPGQWSLGGPLGDLIRIATSRIGNGSTWMEFDLEFAIDLGVVRLEGATIRLTVEPFSVELRGLTAVINVPGVVEGKGSVTIGEAGAIRALLGVTVVPARLGAYGALAIDHDFVAVEVGVQFPVGIPLANTGLGLFGLMGRFVANGTRNLDGLPNPDPVQRELDWYARQPEQKYRRQSGQFALGLGALIGTLPDSAFTFNAEGSIALGFPDISVLFGIDAKLLTPRKQSATERGTPNSSTFRILGMTLIDANSVLVAVRATYEIPKIVRINVPFSAFYPLSSSGLAWYIRLGTDNHPDRPGSPITVTLFPDIIDVKAWAFVMIEERGLQGLGGTLVPADMVPPLDFDGYAIGVGAGFQLKKKAGPFKVELGAFLLVGMGTKPLLFAGAAGVRGELDLKVGSIGVDGLVHFHVSPDVRYLDGHFCGKISFFFFSVKGCVNVHFGDDVPLDVPKPASPLVGVDLCDHLAATKGKAAADLASASTVWPDTVAVLKFSHYVEDALGAVPATDFDRRVSSASLAPGNVWSGSSELKYAYRLDKLELFKLTGGNPANDADWTKVAGPFDSAWWLPSHRNAAAVGGNNAPGSSEEGRELGLFHWDPRAWSRWLGEGSQDLPGDPAGTVDHVCDEPKPAEPCCAMGEDARPVLVGLAAFDAKCDAQVLFPSRFSATALAGDGFDPDTIAALAGDAGWTYRPGQVGGLHGAVKLGATIVSRGWRFPALSQGNQLILTPPVRFRNSKPLLSGEIILEICTGRQAARIEPPAGWDRMPTAPAEIKRFTGESGAIYRSDAEMRPATADERAILKLAGRFEAKHNSPVPLVRLDLRVKRQTKIVALDADGREVARETVKSVRGSSGFTTIMLQASAISGFVIDGADGAQLSLVRWGADDQVLLGEVAELPTPDLPAVVGVTVGGKRVPLTPRVIPPVDIGANTCFKFAYPLPDLGVGSGDGWAAVEVAAHRRGEIALVELCGITLEAGEAQATDADFRGSLTGLLTGLVGQFAANEPTRKIELDADTAYQLRATWSYQGWRPDNPGDAPPSPASRPWEPGDTDRFAFRTAAVGVSQPQPAATASIETDPAQAGPGYDERVFDARGLARYIMAATPDHTGAPHFLDDRVGFWFSVDHIESLLDHYDRLPLVRVLRTDPGPAALHNVPSPPAGGQHPLDTVIATHFALETLTWFEADHRFVVAAEEAPCIGGTPPLGSSSISVEADLKPHADYDLTLSSAPKTVGQHPEVPVARLHFRTSRYRNPTEFLGALGFHTPIGIAHPYDAIATGPLPAAGPLEINDARLDEMLGTLGLDPWPLPAAPRTSLIWSRPGAPGQPWAIIGALVEANEAVFRPGFATGAAGEPTPPPRMEVGVLQLRRNIERILPSFPLPGRRPRPTRIIQATEVLGSLVERVRNAAGTRLLFLATAPIPVTGGLTYDLLLQLNERGAPGASGTLPVYDRPLSVFQEGE